MQEIYLLTLMITFQENLEDFVFLGYYLSKEELNKAKLEFSKNMIQHC